MPSPLLRGLSDSAKKAYPYILRGIREGKTANTLTTELRELGQGLRRQSLLDAVRVARGVLDSGQSIRARSLGAKVQESDLQETGLKQRRTYNFTVQARVYDAEADERFNKIISISSDRLLSRREIGEEARDILEGDEYGYGYEVTGVTILSGSFSRNTGV